MDLTDQQDLVECLAVCPLQERSCLQVCSRAAEVGARQRGLPFYVPFRQAPLQDWDTLFPGSPGGLNWAAFDGPEASFAPWIRASVPWQSEWALSGPPLSPTMLREGASACHARCEEMASAEALSIQEGLGPLPGVYTGWWQQPWSQLYAPPVRPAPVGDPGALRAVAFGEYLQAAMGPTSALSARAPAWELETPLGAASFRAEHIPVNGQPVAFSQSLPTPLPADLRE